MSGSAGQPASVGDAKPSGHQAHGSLAIAHISVEQLADKTMAERGSRRSQCNQKYQHELEKHIRK